MGHGQCFLQKPEQNASVHDNVVENTENGVRKNVFGKIVFPGKGD